MNRILKALLFALIFIAFAYSAPVNNVDKSIETGDFRVANDKWIQRVSGHIIPYDKPVHLVVYGFFGLIGGFILTKSKRRTFWIYTSLMALAGLLWEIKDAYVYWETAPYITLGPLDINVGGDGFSWKDLVANGVGYLIGILPLFAVRKLVEKRKAP